MIAKGTPAMCGRFTLRSNPSQIAQAFDLGEVPELPPRYNVAPSQDVATVRLNAKGQRELAFLHWGLIPFWANDASIGNRLINARAETVAEKPSFRHAFAKRRCLIVADGFYEWQKLAGGNKQPHFIHRRDDQPFAFGGLWESWVGDGRTVESCTIITTTANELMEPLHDRMPVILSAEDYRLWLDGDFKDKDALKGLLRPCDAALLEAHPVSTLVNSPRNDEAECLKRSD